MVTGRTRNYRTRPISERRKAIPQYVGQGQVPSWARTSLPDASANSFGTFEGFCCTARPDPVPARGPQQGPTRKNNSVTFFYPANRRYPQSTRRRSPYVARQRRLPVAPFPSPTTPKGQLKNRSLTVFVALQDPTPFPTVAALREPHHNRI